MAMTKTIQATVKNRTDTAANWTQKNPVLAEGEIIVVQTSAGETRLKIGDGVKTFTQLPYTDEQIYNNVVTSVNGETGDVTLDIPGVQPDWNQNDETQPDYVKNRPFYIGNPVETVLVEESTVTFEDDGGIYMGQLESTFSATVGETYKVSWDGTTYECACVDYSGTTVIGNLSIIGVGSDTGEPFLMFVNNGLFAIGTADTASSHTFSISGMLPKVVKIDPKYLPIPFKPKGKSYLTFSSRNSFTLEVNNSTKYWDGTIEYFASDETWTVWDGTSSLLAVANGSEYVLYLRGTGNTVISNGVGWNLEGFDISCIGNIETLLDYATVESGEHPVMAASCYSHMFQDCTNLTRAPELPATTLANSCYSFMFKGCISLTQAPELPATALANSCYQGMFHNCTSLTHAPALPATTLAETCYQDMFNGCTSLTQAPALPATTLAVHCYYGMFSGCTSLTRAPELPATTLADYCYNWMFIGCTSLTHAPALPATTLADHCYWYMFSGCTSLAQAPELPATALANSCYQGMFYNCTSLKLSSTKTDEYTQEYRIPSSGNGTMATDALTNMFTSTGGTFTGTPEINTIYYLSSDNMIVRGNDIANLNGYVKTMIDTAVDIPTTLPNPNALTFTGAVTGSYDGSAPISVNIPTVPTKTSQLTNDSGFLTSHQDISGKQDKATLEADVAAKGFTKNTGTYSKPAGGIPKSDLDAAVQTSLGKADTALQEHQSLAAYRTAVAQDEIDSGKVDKVTGKGLSTNDYTASAKAKVDAIPANPKYTDTVYDDTAINERVATIEGKESAWDAKSDFSGSYNDLTDKPTIPTALPNPNALTFTGAVTGSYNGSEPVTINIPESGAGNMKKLTFTGAVTGEYDGTTDVNVNIPIATTSTAGTIKVGNGLSISADGTLSVTTATYYTGTADPVNTLGADGDLYLKTEG